LGILTVVLSGIAAISLVVGGIGIMNIMLVTVTERTKEIGLLKAIGAKRRDILMQFLIESVILTVTGGLIGIILGVGIGYVIATAVNVPFGLPVIPVIASVSVSIVIGVVFGSYPAYRASKLSPIDALHYE
jgi:putative ABC transport system permease protein